MKSKLPTPRKMRLATKLIVPSVVPAYAIDKHPPKIGTINAETGGINHPILAMPQFTSGFIKLIFRMVTAKYAIPVEPVIHKN